MSEAKRARVDEDCNGGPTRTATVERVTKETQVKVVLNLDGTGQANINTGIGFVMHLVSPLCVCYCKSVVKAFVNVCACEP